MGKQTLILSPDPGITAADNESAYNFILFDPERLIKGVAYRLRLLPRKYVAFDHKIDYQEQVISSRSDRVGVFTGIDGKMVPQIYPVEALGAWLNEQASATGM